MEEIASKAERTRQFIIENTANIFNKKGYAGTSMADLTEATGLTKGAIYGNFRNKEEVGLAAFQYNYSRITGAIEHRISAVNTFREKLMVYAHVYDLYTEKIFPDGGCPILNTAIEADDTNELLKERAGQAVINWQANIEEIINSGIKAEEFKKDTDASSLATAIIALLEGGIMISRVTNKHSAMQRVVGTIGQLIEGVVVG